MKISTLYRVGAPGANIGEKAKTVLVDKLVNDYLDMNPVTWQHQMQHAQHQVAQLSQNIAALHAHISLIEMPVRRSMLASLSKCASWITPTSVPLRRRKIAMSSILSLLLGAPNFVDFELDDLKLPTPFAA